MKITRILRYPVKSLSVEELGETTLTPGQGLPYDRHWALAKPDGDADDAGTWCKKLNFVVLVKQFALATLDFRLGRGAAFTLKGAGVDVAGDLDTADGRAALADAVTRHLDLPPEAAPRVVEAGDFGYFDSSRGAVALLNMDSHRDLERVMGRGLDPVRFRMNLLFDGADAWSELHWVGKEVRVGEAV
ncbi:MAG: MOSC N-terminal beta barrel domain-containing protein, partial [Alphaproteobacteria bacterium]|nr:MOSC N-terminal beta barrel domain-containing protein [Alphaproteobacteria bacterium]